MKDMDKVVMVKIVRNGWVLDIFYIEILGFVNRLVVVY